MTKRYPIVRILLGVFCGLFLLYLISVPTTSALFVFFPHYGMALQATEYRIHLIFLVGILWAFMGSMMFIILHDVIANKEESK